MHRLDSSVPYFKVIRTFITDSFREMEAPITVIRKDTKLMCLEVNLRLLPTFTALCQIIGKCVEAAG